MLSMIGGSGEPLNRRRRYHWWDNLGKEEVKAKQRNKTSQSVNQYSRPVSQSFIHNEMLAPVRNSVDLRRFNE